ncbi:ABC transporter permease [Falsiroseomonas sp. HW251]|uniref:ABC transporter permease n=1 Tax=Falsiroseomonas sp. HW251 TaxID=3390998 RepID=UPI003D31AC10
MTSRTTTGVPSASRPLPAAATGWLLAGPSVLFLLGFFILPAAQTLWLGVAARTEAGVMQYGFTLENYQRAFATDLYWRILLRTARMASLAALAAAIVGFPLAWAVARAAPWISRIVTLVLVTPLLVNVVVRSYGWSAILSRNGLIAWTLGGIGIEDAPSILYTEAAVLIASVHVFLPFMVLPLAGAIARIPPAAEQAATIAGAGPLQRFLRIVLPLSLPGLAVGLPLVFSLTAAAYVTPQILGGNFSPLLGTLIQQQVLTLHDWPFGAALSTLLVAMVLAVNLVFIGIVGRRLRRWTAAA